MNEISETLDKGFPEFSELLRKQGALELESLEWGIKEYRQKLLKIQQGTSSITNLPPGLKLLQESTIRVEKELKAFLINPHLRRRSHTVQYLRATLKLNPSLRLIDISFLICRELINHISLNNEKFTNWAQLGRLAYEALDSHLSFLKLREESPNYVKAVLKAKSISRNKNRTSKVFDQLAKNRGIVNKERPESFKLALGATLVDIAIDKGGFCKKEVKYRSQIKRKQIQLTFDPKVEAWMLKAHEYLMDKCPKNIPMIIKPIPRSTMCEGGYLTKVAHNGDLVTKLQGDKERITFYENKDFPKVFRCINSLQDTGFKVNEKVLNVMKQIWESGVPMAGLPRRGPLEIPSSPYSNEEWSLMRERKTEEYKERLQMLVTLHNNHRREKSKVTAVGNSIVIANKLKGEPELYFPFNLDFRGRINSIPQFLNPQGFESSKALLEFSEPEVVTVKGERWLHIHSSNCWGNDKVSNTQRYLWVINKWDHIERSVEDPLGYRWWMGAEDPFRFLASCFELCRKDHLSTLPVSQDGTCNGLQHFSMILRDEEGGLATNLVPSDKPSDIYSIVLKDLINSIKEEEGEGLGKYWLDSGNLDRDLIKRPVMTDPYSVTSYGIQQQLRAHIHKFKHKYDLSSTKHLKYLTLKLIGSIGKVVKSSRLVRNYLQNIARIMFEKELPIEWSTPSEFEVYQRYPKYKIMRVKTSTENHKITIRYPHRTSEINSRKQVQAITPNFIHSMDASHLVLTVNECKRQGINSIQTIHDSFSCHCSNVDKMNKIIREQFHKMYTENDVLKSFTDSCINKIVENSDIGAEFPKALKLGTLNPDLVLDSEYFFS